MKIKPHHYEKLETHIVLAQRFVNHRDKYVDRDLTLKRWRWDCFCEAAIRSSEFKDLIKEIYQYANDTHIDTALRKITKTK